MSVTPDLCRKVGMGIATSPSPLLTSLPERHRATENWSSIRQQDRDREVNVQVLLRCRPLSDEEHRSSVQKVICNGHKREVTVLHSVANKPIDRVFTFDKVFGPKSLQKSIYDQAISPIVNEVLEGFNCTILAYGQTGTGKTYTMEGEMRNKGGDLPAQAGVIPRAVRQIFDMLEAQSADYSMKVTFLELYNEEITDLLAPDDNSRFAAVEDKQKKPISLVEAGNGCVVVRGLEEEAVNNVNEIYTLLERGATKRRTADTLLNKRSSLSHSVFSITVHIKEAADGDKELFRYGKLNLVDLAGSEKAWESHAREAGEINKSCLSLCGVINALVEHSSHIPYRDSKLTGLLRDSLGGKTKTCIIATISPSAHSLEETLSTLDHAYRAKNIKNKPEANQKMSKAVLLKDLYLELEKMKEDVRAAREKNGIFVLPERFAQDEAEKKARNEKIEQLENDLNLAEKQVDSFRELYLSEQEQKLDLQCDLNDCRKNLETSNKALLDLQEKYRVAMSTIKKEFIISNSLCSDQKDKMEAENQNLVLTFGSELDQSSKDLHKTILGSVSHQTQQIRTMEEHFCTNLTSKCDMTQASGSWVNNMTDTYCSGVAGLKELAYMLQRKAPSDPERINGAISTEVINVENFLTTMVMDAEERADYSSQPRRNSQLSINNLNKENVAEMQSAVNENICTIHVAHEEFVSASLNSDAELNARSSDTSMAINDSLNWDQENNEEIDSMAALCLDQVKSVQENHGKSTSISEAKQKSVLSKITWLIGVLMTPLRNALQVCRAWHQSRR